MRKLLFFLCTLLTGVGTMWADGPDVTGKSFTLTCARGSVYWNGTTMVGSSDKTKFAIVEYENETYLYDVDHQAFVVHTAANYQKQGTTGNPCGESTTDFSKIVKGLSWGNTDIEAYPYYLADENDNWLNMDNVPNVYLNTWKEFEGGKGGNTYKVEDIEDFTSTEAVAMLDSYFHPSTSVKYVITDQLGTQVFASEIFPAEVGTTITELPEAYKRSFCTYTVSPTTITEGENTVNVTVTYTMPFQVSESLDAAKWYYMTLREHNVYYDEESGEIRTNQTTYDPHSDAYQWAFFGSPYDGIKVANKQTRTYFANTPNSVTLSDEGYAWTIKGLDNDPNIFGLNNGTNYINEQNHTNHNLIYWGGFDNDKGSQFMVDFVPDGFVDVVYKIYYNDELLVTTESEERGIGKAPAVPQAYERDYTTYSYNVTEITATTTEVRVDVTWNGLPFELSADYSSAKWYYLHGHSGNDERYISTDGDATRWAVGNDMTENYLWAFTGNPIQGIKLINMASGEGMELQGTDPATMGTNGKAWILKEQKNATNANNKPNPFGLYDTQLTYLNTQNGTLKYWGSFDGGSTFWVEEPETVYQALIAELETIASSKIGNDLGQYHWSDGDKTSEIQRLKSAGFSVANNQEVLALFDGFALNIPASGTFLRITGTTSNNHLAGGTATHNNGSTVYAMTDAEDATTIFYYDGTHLTNLGTGKTNNMSSASWNWVYGNTNGATVEFGDGGTNGGYYIKSGDRYFYDNGDNENNGYADRGSANSGARYNSWSLAYVDVLPLTIADEVGYATLWTPVALSIPEDVTAYTGVINDNKDYLNLTELTDGVIPAETAVILKGTGSYDFEVATEGGNAVENDLQGGLGLATASDILTLQNIEGVGFYSYDGTGLAGFKAYLSLGAGVKGLTLNFGTTDGIATVEGATTEDAAIYNLAGQRVEKAVKGVYIINGKKVLVK